MSNIEQADEAVYLSATKEVNGEARSEALWAKAMALCDGDELKAKYKYISMRAEQSIEPQFPSKPPLKMKWFKYWTYFNLPFLIIGVFVEEVYLNVAVGGSEALTTTIVGLVFMIPFLLLLVGLHRKQEWAWWLNWVAILAIWYFATTMQGTAYINNLKSSLLDGSDPAPGTYLIYSVQFIIGAVIWVVPNYFYWKKRKGLFNNTSAESSWQLRSD